MFRKMMGWAGAFCLLFALPAEAEPAGAAEEPAVSAKSAMLYEPVSGRVLLEKDAHTPRPMASTTKIMTALIAMESCQPEREVTVAKEAVLVEGSSLGLRGGDKINMRDLVTGLMLVSGNDAANAIAMEMAGSLPAFAEMMNRKAQELGMKDSSFVTPSGLDAEGHAASAYDMALLAAAALRNNDLAEICAMRTAKIRLGNPQRVTMVSNHNRLLSLYPYAVGMKTGFTKKSGRCLVSAARKDGVTLVAVTLNAPDDWNDHIAMYERGFAMVESVSLPAPALPDLPVGGGRTSALTLTMDTPPAVPLLKGEGERVETIVELPRFLMAPVLKGEQVGMVHYWAGGRELAALPIRAAYKIDERPVADYGGSFKVWLGNLLRAFLC